jgi:hypothetical protein
MFTRLWSLGDNKFGYTLLRTETELMEPSEIAIHLMIR